MFALPNVVAEFRYGKDRKSDAKPADVAGNKQRWIDQGYPSKTVSATHKAVS
jgi:hypothetical protein